MSRSHRSVLVTVQPTYDWTSFASQGANLLIWEAFVSGTSETGGTGLHIEDATVAARAFWASYRGEEAQASNVTAQNPYSLVGAALLRAGLSDELSFLREPCVVIKAQKA